MQPKVIQNNKNHTPRITKHTLNLKNHTFHLTNHTFFKHYIRNSRILTITGLTSTLLLSLLILTIYQPLYYHGKNEQKVIATTGSSIQATTSLSITAASNVAGVDLLVKDNNGTFASSDDSGNTLGFSVATDYHNGYTLSITSNTNTNSNSNNDGKLIYEINSSCKENNTCPALNSITTASSTITANGTWGYKPSKLCTSSDASSCSSNTGDNSVYLPSPTTTPTILDKTTTANTTGTANSYSIAIGAKADYTQIPGVYSNSYILQAIVNIVEHAITFNKDDNITSIVIKDANDTSNTTIATITNNADTINLIYGDTYIIELNFADNYELDSLIKSSGVGELTIDTSGSSTNITKAIFTVGNGIATIDAKSKSSRLYMWNATSADCGKTMYDNRDGTEMAYTTASINGLCWMTTNLALGASAAIELTPATSNVPPSGYTLPASSTAGFTHSDDQNIYNSGSVTCGSNSPCYGYYTYDAATAGAISQAYSICPANWRLPTKDEMSALTDIYSTGVALISDPFKGNYAGYYNSGSLTSSASYGYYWSSTSYNTSYAWVMYLYNDRAGVNRASYGYKSRGYSIRCVAKT